MLRTFLIAIPLTVCGCQQKVTVPTHQELMSNPQLLAAWQAKCSTGKFSHLPASQKDEMCFTTREAARSVAITAAAKSEADFFETNAIRK